MGNASTTCYVVAHIVVGNSAGKMEGNFMSSLPGTPSSWRGISMAELMIALAIVAVIVTIAYPSYRDFVLQARRTEATQALLDSSGPDGRILY